VALIRLRWYNIWLLSLRERRDDTAACRQLHAARVVPREEHRAPHGGGEGAGTAFTHWRTLVACETLTVVKTILTRTARGWDGAAARTPRTRFAGTGDWTYVLVNTVLNSADSGGAGWRTANVYARRHTALSCQTCDAVGRHGRHRRSGRRSLHAEEWLLFVVKAYRGNACKTAARFVRATLPAAARVPLPFTGYAAWNG